MKQIYEFTILMKKIVEVSAEDDINAELEAAKSLTKSERENAIELMWANLSTGDKVTPHTIDKDFWKENGL